MIGYYLPQVSYGDASAFVAASRLNTMGKWRCLNDGKAGSIVYQEGWQKTTAKVVRETSEGWGYAPNCSALPKLETLLRQVRPESESITLEDGTSILLPLMKCAPRRAVFAPGGGGYGLHIKEWSKMALQLWNECTVIQKDGSSRVQFNCAMADLLATLYACLVQNYFLTHELATDILCLSDVDMCKCMYTIWGYSPKVSRDDGENLPSSRPDIATESHSLHASSSA